MSRHIGIIPALALLFWPCSFAHPVESSNMIYTGVVERVIDGDTIHCLLQLQPETLRMFARIGVRLAGVDAPELKGKCEIEKALAKKALETLRSLLPSGSAIFLTNVDSDKYTGRLVASIQTGLGKDVAEQMSAAGLVRPYAGRGPRPDWCASGSHLKSPP